MKIGIDISQTAFQGTGVGNFTLNLVKKLIDSNEKNEYVLFFSSLRGKMPEFEKKENVVIKKFKFPPTLLDLLWNRLHILPIENLIGNVDVFITSDWTEPPTKSAKKTTIIYDLIVYKYPEETHKKTEFNPFKMIISPNIVDLQKRKLEWVKKESDKIMCISQATKKDVEDILKIPASKLSVVYPGL